MPLSHWTATELRTRGSKNIAEVATKYYNSFGDGQLEQDNLPKSNNNRRQTRANNTELCKSVSCPSVAL